MSQKAVAIYKMTQGWKHEGFNFLNGISSNRTLLKHATYTVWLKTMSQKQMS